MLVLGCIVCILTACLSAYLSTCSLECCMERENAAILKESLKPLQRAPLLHLEQRWQSLASPVHSISLRTRAHWSGTKHQGWTKLVFRFACFPYTARHSECRRGSHAPFGGHFESKTKWAILHGWSQGQVDGVATNSSLLEQCLTSWCLMHFNFKTRNSRG